MRNAGDKNMERYIKINNPFPDAVSGEGPLSDVERRWLIPASQLRMLRVQVFFDPQNRKLVVGLQLVLDVGQALADPQVAIAAVTTIDATHVAKFYAWADEVTTRLRNATAELIEIPYKGDADFG
jgi:hypothetical protein